MCNLPSQQYLRECFDYDLKSGKLYWSPRPSSHFKTTRGWRTHTSQRAGKEAGCLSENKDGSAYLKVRLDKRLYFVHRIIWKIMHGDIPECMEVDHINGATTDNRISQLRLVDATGNMSNKRLWCKNKSGHYGVYQNKKNGTWYVQAWRHGKYYSGGSGLTFDQAIEARERLESHLGFHDNHGRS